MLQFERSRTGYCGGSNRTAEKNFVVTTFITCWAGHVARMGENVNAYTVLVGKPDGMRPAGKRKLDVG